MALVHQDGGPEGHWLCGVPYAETGYRFAGHAVTCWRCLEILNPPPKAMKEIIYNSPSMGWVKLLRTDADVWFRGTTLEALEERLSQQSRTTRLVDFYLRADSFDAIAAELEGRAKYVAPTIDSLAGFTDERLRTECERRFGGETYKQQMEIMQCEVAQLTKRLDGKQSVLWEFRRMCERFGIPDGVDELAWLPACLSRLAEFEAQRTTQKREAATLFGVDANLNAGMRAMGLRETGPGIVGVKVEKDTSVYVLDEDLLCRDE